MAKRTPRTSVAAGRRGKRFARLPVGVDVLFRKRLRSERAPRLTDAAVARAEATLGVRLPRSYVGLMKERNGGELRLTGIVFDAPLPFGLTRGRMFCVERIAGISDTKAFSINRLSRLAHTRWGVPDLLLPLEGERFWCLCLDYRDCGAQGEPAITHYESSEATGGEPRECRIAESFEAMIRSLVFDSNDRLIFAIDPAALGGSELAVRLKALGCRVYRPKGQPKTAPPVEWTWTRFRAAFALPVSARLEVVRNGRSGDPWYPDHAAGGPLLLVHVSERDQEPCAHQLLIELAGGLSLLHVPPDRKPIRGCRPGR